MSITIRFKCGHSREWADGDDAPVCAECGERQIARTVAPPPRFRGVASGPLMQKDQTHG